ncbi:hypothetical protein [Amycolatopsis sp. lyj-109]
MEIFFEDIVERIVAEQEEEIARAHWSSTSAPPRRQGQHMSGGREVREVE